MFTLQLRVHMGYSPLSIKRNLILINRPQCHNYIYETADLFFFSGSNWDSNSQRSVASDFPILIEVFKICAHICRQQNKHVCIECAFIHNIPNLLISNRRIQHLHYLTTKYNHIKIFHSHHCSKIFSSLRINPRKVLQKQLI